MAVYLKLVRELMKSFDSHEVKHIPRDENQYADSLTNLGSATDKTIALMI